RPGTFNPGLVSTFGGRIEKDETPVQCARRELYEETSLEASEEDLRSLVETQFVRADKSTTNCTVYVLENVDPRDMTLQEGRGIELVSGEEAVDNHDLT